MENSFSNTFFMEIAIEEQNKCSSYPKVGTVIVKNGKILSKAYRMEIEGKHAERIAIEKLNSPELVGSTIITTLEPCIEIKPEQNEMSCTDLIIKHQFNEVVIGILDPNGKIYCQGYQKLLEKGVKVCFFIPKLREIIEANTFKYGDCGKGFGPSGKRRVMVIGSGKYFEIQFSQTDGRKINFHWSTLQFRHGIVDLIGENHSIRSAIGIKKFNDISDPLIFREPSHFSRMKNGDIAIIEGSFIILIKLIEMTETDIYFQWEVRNK
jgi:diaminohydroxyphosphoribosylaminopyrimidine deaminase/5-amino-6-(5-phosphoribosylamino)uracil reductase